MLKRIEKKKARAASSPSQKKKRTSVGCSSHTQSIAEPQIQQTLRRHDEPQPSIDVSTLSSHGTQEGLNCDTVSSAEPQKKRGRTMLPDIWSLTENEKLPDKFNVYNQCVDDGELGDFCGTIARNPDLTPLEFDDWRNVPKDKKDEMWRIVQTKFDLDPRRRSWVLSKIGFLLKNYKHTLYTSNFFKYKTLAELKANRDPETRQDQWEKLVTKWFTPEWQDKSEKNKKSRKEMQAPHTSGRISYARRAEMEYQKTGIRPDRTSLFLKYHKLKNGKPVNTTTGAILERIEEVRAQMRANNDTTQVSNSFASLKGDPLHQVLGKERNGRVRGMGFKVTPKMFSKANCKLVQERDQAVKEKKECEERLTILSNNVMDIGQLMNRFLANSGFDHIEQVQDIRGAMSSILATFSTQPDATDANHGTDPTDANHGTDTP